MRAWDRERIAREAGASLLSASVSAPSSSRSPEPPQSPEPSDPREHESGHEHAPGPRRAGVDSRTSGPGELFFGLRGERSDGGAHAAEALRRGAWGVLVTPKHAGALRSSGAGNEGGAVLAHPDPLAAMHALTRAWRAELGAHGAKVIAITGSAGKTSTKDILAAMLGARMPTVATSANLNTEIGLPLTVLAAPPGTRALVLEMAMRGAGQIALLTRIAAPDVGVIVNVGPAHLELLGTLAAIAAAKAELIAGLADGAVAVVPAGEALLREHLRAELRTIAFGEGGEVSLLERHADGSVVIAAGEERISLRPSFAQAHNLVNLLAAVAAARAIGFTPHGELEVSFSAMRGQRFALPGGAVLIDDCYNANPMSMRAAIDDLAETARGRRVAVLGDMLELGPDSPRMHREIGEHAGARGVGLLIAVGPLAAEAASCFAGEARSVPDAAAAAELLAGLLRDGDTVLVKGSRVVGLELVAESLRERAAAGSGGEPAGPGSVSAGRALASRAAPGRG